MKLRYPNITGKTQEEQLVQIRGYLYQLVQQINMEASNSGSNGVVNIARTGNWSGAAEEQQTSPKASFNQIKSLIIKSADIVEAYYQEIRHKLDTLYVAESVFGTYRNEVSNELRICANSIDSLFNDIQSITGQLNQVITVNANIRTGLLYYVDGGGDALAPELPEGTPVYGVEIGQTTMLDDKQVFDKFARFTAYGMIFYDENGNPSVYISDQKLRIPHAVIQQSLTRGGFVETVGNDGSSVERWVGV